MKGGKGYREVVTQKAKEILKSHRPEPLPETVRRQIAAIAKKAEKALESFHFKA
jgi:trimethylamine:corrinoid methyltransferase-like protein